LAPFPESRTAPRQPARGDGQAEQQAALERKGAQQPLQTSVPRQQAGVLRRDPGEQREQTQLHAEQSGCRGIQHAVNIEPRAHEMQRREVQRRGQGDAGDQQREPRVEKQPARAEEEQKAQMPPAVAPGAQVRRPSAPVRRERGRDFGDAPSRQRRLHYQLARELHAGGPQVERAHGFAVEAAQAAMEVADPRAKQQAADEAQHRVAEVAVQKGHGPFADLAAKAVAHDQRIAFAQPGHEAVEAREVIAVVGVAHDDVAAARRGDPSGQRRAVAAPGHVDHSRAGALRQLARAVVGAVVGDQHFAVDSRALQEAARLGNAAADGHRLVQAGHQNRQLGHRRPRAPQKKRYPEGYLLLKLGLAISRGRSRAGTSPARWSAAWTTPSRTASRTGSGCRCWPWQAYRPKPAAPGSRPNRSPRWRWLAQLQPRRRSRWYARQPRTWSVATRSG